MADGPEDVPQQALALELYQRQLDALSRQIEFLQGVLDDLRRAQTALESFGESANREVLVPLGASTFVRGRIEDADQILLGIGAGYATERPRADAIAQLSSRAEQVEKELERAMQTAVQLQQDAAQFGAGPTDEEE